jgi:hypothetical protein
VLIKPNIGQDIYTVSEKYTFQGLVPFSTLFYLKDTNISKCLLTGEKAAKENNGTTD